MAATAQLEAVKRTRSIASQQSSALLHIASEGNGRRLDQVAASIRGWLAARVVVISDYNLQTGIARICGIAGDKQWHTEEGLCRAAFVETHEIYEFLDGQRTVWSVSDDEGRCCQALNCVSDLCTQRDHSNPSKADPLPAGCIFRAALDGDSHNIRIVSMLCGSHAPQANDVILSRLEQALPLLREQIRLSRLCDDFKAERDAANGALDRLSVGVMLVDAQGRVTSINRRAHEILSENESLIMAKTILCTSNRQDTIRLHAMIAELSEEQPNEAAFRVLGLRRAEDKPPLVVVGVRTCEISQEATSGAVVTLFLADPQTNYSDAAMEVGAMFGLTPVESKLAALIVGGECLQDAARTLKISPHTARAYLKQVFAKTGANRQAALVRLLLMTCAHVNLTPNV